MNLLNDLAIRLGKSRCKWVRYPKGCKDLNEALVKYGHPGVVQALSRAQWMRVDGMFRMSELPPVNDVSGFDVGMPGLNDHYRIRPGDLCVITGIPSHGKTTFVNDVVCRMVERYGWSAAFASFEQNPQLDHKRALRTFFSRKRVKDQTDAEIVAADAWIDAKFTFIVPSEDDEASLDWVLERCGAAVIQHGAKIIVIDPWNEMDHTRPPDMSLTEYTGFAIKQFRKLAKKYQAHVIVVAHPTKQAKDKEGKVPPPTLYDISDSAHWFNKCDVGIVIHRLDEGRTLIRTAKSRYHDQIGKPGDLQAIFLPTLARYDVIPDEVAG